MNGTNYAFYMLHKTAKCLFCQSAVQCTCTSDSSLELGVIRPNNQCRQYSEAWCKYLFFPQAIVSDFVCFAPLARHHFLKGSVFSVPLRTEIEPRCVALC